MAYIITEQCGAVWNYRKTGFPGDRAYWVQRTDSKIYSVAKPHTIGFYVANLDELVKQLSN